MTQTTKATKEDIAWSKGYAACIKETKRLLNADLKRPNLRSEYKFWLGRVIKMLGEKL